MSVVGLLLASALTASCGANDRNSDVQAGAVRSPSAGPVSISVQVWTSNGIVGRNYDDTACVWRDPAYAVRDGAGTVIATGTPPIETTLGDDPGAFGEIVSFSPEYRCELVLAISTIPEEVYQLDVTTGVYRGEATFSFDAMLRGPIVIEITE